MGTTLKRIIIAGWQDFSRDGGIAVATIFILAMVIFLVSTIFLSKDVSQFLTNVLQEKVDISVYFKENTGEEDILNIKEEISQIDKVKEVEYVSKEMALGEFVKKHKDESLLMESLAEVGQNPFLASLNIKAWDASQYGVISTLLEKPELKSLIEKVDYYQRKPAIERIFSLTDFFNKTLLFLSVILIITAILVTFNTIRLAILNSIEEIKIQRLVGASNWFIRGPFLVQGAISGTIATLISLSILSLICWFLSPKIEFFFAGLNLFNLFIKNIWVLFLIQFSTGTLLAIISSTIAIRKYLKV